MPIGPAPPGSVIARPPTASLPAGQVTVTVLGESELKALVWSGIRWNEKEPPGSPLSPFAPWIPWSPLAPAGPVGPVSPLAPADPVGPVSPLAPAGPAGPVAPVSPLGPAGPAGPWGPPAGPAGPVAPVSPLAPAAPVAPVAPLAPAGPAGPWAPVAPAGSCPPKSAAVSDRSLTFGPVTAPPFSCFVPTLLAGSLAAAYDVPPSAMKSASIPRW